jgi:hypothetical protein
MFATDDPAEHEAPPTPIEVVFPHAKPVRVYAPVNPYEQRPENAAALIGWTARTQRRNLTDLIGAHGRATVTREFFGGMAREALFKLDGLGSDW